jgi:hypothetical protein
MMRDFLFAQVQELVGEQTREWSAMVSRQLLEEHTSLRGHIEQQNELLTRLMEESRVAQVKELEARQDRSVTCITLPNYNADLT